MDGGFPSELISGVSDDSNGPNPYEHLGFNPAPGVVDTIDAVVDRLSKAADSLGQSHQLISKLSGDQECWQGDAADAFRQHLNEKLPGDLQNAHTSLSNAAQVLRGWQQNLTGYQSHAASLNTQAGDLQERYPAAYAAYVKAKNNGAFKMIGQEFHSQQALQAAQQQIDEAASSLRSAEATVSELYDQFQGIIKQAQELEGECSKVGGTVAGELRATTSNLAPHKPGLFSSMLHGIESALGDAGNWIKSHLDVIHTILSSISAVAGLLALVLPPPADAVALGVAAVASLGAFATDLANPQFREGIGNFFSSIAHGKMPSGEDWEDMSTGVGDLLGAIPCAGMVKEGVKTADFSLDGVKAATGVADKAGALADATGDAAKGFGRGVSGALNTMKDWENPTIAWAKDALHLSDRAGDAIELGVSSVGVAGAGIQVAKQTGLLPDDSPAFNTGGLAVDGAKLGAFEIPEGVSNVIHIVKDL